MLGVLAPAPTASGLPPGSIAGVVRDDIGAPFEGIEVTVWDNVGYGEIVVGQDVTGADGAYQVDGIDPDAYYKVRFSDQDAAYATEWHRNVVAGTFATWVPVAEGEVNTLPDTELEPGGSISGRLTVGAGTPVDQGTVSVWWQYAPRSYAWMEEHTTDSDGRYVIPALPAATYALSFRDPASGATETWNDQGDITSATSIVVASGDHVTGIGALLGGVVTEPPAPPVAAVVNHRLPLIRGILRVGRTIRVTKGIWTPAPSRLDYAWYASGRLIKRADRPRLTLTRKHLGKRMTVRVTASAPSYQSLTVRTARTAKVRR
ncbi:hypothetical protein CFI00_16890 [Nocardioides sp. S5]|nr:hypothetical protein CFI00_16890 [Nocardioides sp. S5]